MTGPNDRARAQLERAIGHLRRSRESGVRGWRAIALLTIAGDLDSLLDDGPAGFVALREVRRLHDRLAGLAPQLASGTFEQHAGPAIRALRAAERELTRAIEGGRR